MTRLFTHGIAIRGDRGGTATADPRLVLIPHPQFFVPLELLGGVSLLAKVLIVLIELVCARGGDM